MKEVDYIFCLNNTDRWIPAFAPIIKPLGKMCAIVSALKPVDLTPLMGKSVTLAWEFMFTRSSFKTPDMIEQHHLLNETAALIEAGTLKTTLSVNLGKITAANLKRAHKCWRRGTRSARSCSRVLTRTESRAESRYAWARLCTALALMTIGGSGMYAITVVLPRVQADFGVGRSDASLPYTFTMIGFGLGGILMGRLSDRFGVMVPVIIGAFGLSAGFIAAGSARQPVAIQSRPGADDRTARHFGHVRAAGRRHFALVHAPPRHCRCDLHQRKLSRRHPVAAADAALYRQRRLAGRPMSASACSAS